MSEELNLDPDVENKFNKVEVEEYLEEDVENLNQINSDSQYSKSQTESSEESNKPNSEEEVMVLGY